MLQPLPRSTRSLSSQHAPIQRNPETNDLIKGRRCSGTSVPLNLVLLRQHLFDNPDKWTGCRFYYFSSLTMGFFDRKPLAPERCMKVGSNF